MDEKSPSVQPTRHRSVFTVALLHVGCEVQKVREVATGGGAVDFRVWQLGFWPLCAHFHLVWCDRVPITVRKEGWVLGAVRRVSWWWHRAASGWRRKTHAMFAANGTDSASPLDYAKNASERSGPESVGDRFYALSARPLVADEGGREYDVGQFQQR